MGMHKHAGFLQSMTLTTLQYVLLMIVVSKPLGGLFSVPDFGLSDVLSIKRESGREQFQVQAHYIQLHLVNDEKFLLGTCFAPLCQSPLLHDKKCVTYKTQTFLKSKYKNKNVAVHLPLHCLTRTRRAFKERRPPPRLNVQSAEVKIRILVVDEHSHQ